MGQKATVGRVVHVYSNLWIGPAIGWVVAAFGLFPDSMRDNRETEHVNVNVSVDGANAPKALSLFRSREQGNTLTSIKLTDPLTPEQRSAELAAATDEQPVFWAEWMPYQVGQAPASSAVIAQLEAMREAIDSIRAKQDQHDKLSPQLITLEKRLDQLSGIIGATVAAHNGLSLIVGHTVDELSKEHCPNLPARLSGLRLGPEAPDEVPAADEVPVPPAPAPASSEV